MLFARPAVGGFDLRAHRVTNSLLLHTGNGDGRLL